MTTILERITRDIEGDTYYSQNFASTGERFLAWYAEARHIEPGSPWPNGLNERSNGSLRDECPNLETSHNRDHARALVRLYARHYDERRPHSSLGYLTPREFAAKRGGETGREKAQERTKVPRSL